MSDTEQDLQGGRMSDTEQDLQGGSKHKI